jgi:two-component system chemotaxis response regulator CheB
MAARIRVLVVDDSAVMRRMITDALEIDPDIEIVGIAANGRIALNKIPLVVPDVVTLDMEMPDLDGLQTLAILRKAYPRLPVIMFSMVTQRGAVATLDALSLGATDYVTKPRDVASIGEAIQRVREQLLPKVKFFGGAVQGTSLTVRPAPPPPRQSIFVAPPSARPPTGVVEILAIGSSTGGPNALHLLFSELARDLPVPVVVTQHMPALFIALLAERLDKLGTIRVREAVAGAKLEPGCAWIATGDKHLRVISEAGVKRLVLSDEPPENSCRPAVDVMLRSVVEVYGSGTLAVILTGMGRDGYLGCELAKQRGGAVLAQDEATSVVWGMPGAVARGGLADKVLPIEKIAAEINRRVQVPARVRPTVLPTPQPVR